MSNKCFAGSDLLAKFVVRLLLVFVYIKWVKFGQTPAYEQ